MLIHKVFSEEDGQEEKDTVHDTRRLIMRLPCLDEECTIETFQGEIMHYPIPDEFGFNLGDFDKIAEFFGLARIRIENGALIIPVSSVTINLMGESPTKITYDSCLFGDPELIIIYRPPDTEHMRNVYVVPVDEIPNPMPPYIRVYGMKDRVITDYIEGNAYDCLISDNVSAHLGFGNPMYPCIMLNKPFEDQETIEFEVEDACTITNRPSAYLLESDITFEFPLKFTIKQDGELILSVSFETELELMLLSMHGTISHHSAAEPVKQDDGRFKVSLLMFLMQGTFPPNLTLEFINDGGQPFEICLVSNPNEVYGAFPYYINMYVENNPVEALVIKYVATFNPDGDPVYKLGPTLVSGHDEVHFYIDMEHIGLDASIPSYDKIHGVSLYDESGKYKLFDKYTRKQKGDCLILPAKIKYVKAHPKYIKYIFCEK